MISSRMRTYMAHMGSLPAALADLNAQQTNGLGQVAGPFMPSTPQPPEGGNPAWSSYTYNSTSTGAFTVGATGDGTTVSAP
jgi:hypothetical protein